MTFFFRFLLFFEMWIVFFISMLTMTSQMDMDMYLELKEIQNAFIRADVNRDGKLEPFELKRELQNEMNEHANLLGSRHPEVSDALVKAAFREHDQDQDGKLSISEFTQMMLFEIHMVTQAQLDALNNADD